ncbi:MAG: Fic family protein [Sporolactobacillus sp.]
MNATSFLTDKEIIFINTILIQRGTFSEDIGVKGSSLLNSAFSRPKQSLFYRDACPTIHLKATALFQSLVQSHPFYHANRRQDLWQW